MNHCSDQYMNMTNEELLEQYSITKDIKLKQEIAMRYTYVIKVIAMQMRDVYLSFAQVDDIVQEGVIVLMNQIDKYDKSKNAKFETYLSRRIKGMIIDIARKNDWCSRSIRKNIKTIDNAIAELTSKYGKTPDSKTVAKYLNMPYEKYNEILKKGVHLSMISLDMVIEEAQEKRNIKLPTANCEEQPEETLLKNEMMDILQQGIDDLKEKEKLIISLYYTEELSMKEIAKVLEISEPRVSQLHSSAIKKLKLYMTQRLNV